MDECRKIRLMCKEKGVTFIVNDHVDIALLVNADGVHIGQDDLSVAEARQLLGPDKIIGLSTHSPQQALDAVAAGADYIGAGPVFKTYTKKDVCNPVGLSYLQWVGENINLPFVAIGGIKEHNLCEILKSGAQNIALVTEITGAENIDKKIKSIQKMIAENQKENVKI